MFQNTIHYSGGSGKDLQWCLFSCTLYDCTTGRILNCGQIRRRKHYQQKIRGNRRVPVVLRGNIENVETPEIDTKRRKSCVVTGQSKSSKLHLNLGAHYGLIGKVSVHWVYCQGQDHRQHASQLLDQFLFQNTRHYTLTCCVGHLQHTLVTGDAMWELYLHSHHLLAVVGCVLGGREPYPQWFLTDNLQRVPLVGGMKKMDNCH